ncbi:MAG: glutamate--tRNA ligase [Syntrophus sp. (in: bacteria)]|nr:glutamate--tRNA ligase [Syntrophus sp. (in: bacteria)]
MVKVRFAPSPTGYLHVGNTRTALMNYLFARKEGGIFILRIEDTDLERSDALYDASIMEDLKWLDIVWDEGPYRQSERTAIYRAYAETLLEKGLAYKCFCSRERLEDMRRFSQEKGIPPRYDGTCRDLSKEGAENMEEAGRPHVVRFKSFRKAICFRDQIHGDMTFPEDHVDDFIILKQELTPSYNFAVTVDDMLMNITHVVRGADHLSNTPKQIMLFQAFDEAPPQYAHHSLLTGDDQKPLSKRHGATQVREFREIGILSKALVNYIGIMGRKTKKEYMDETELINTFSFESLSASDSLFDMEKLFWFNREYIRKIPIDALLAELDLTSEYEEKVTLLRENVKTLAEIREYLDIFDGVEITEESISFLSGIKEPGKMADIAQGFLEDPDLSFEQIAKAFQEATGLPKRDVFMVLRILSTGRRFGPPLKEVFPLIGKENIVKRISCLRKNLLLS